MSENMGRELGWDDVIENDGPEFVLLPEGDYDFEVTAVERGRHNGSEKLPPCSKAIISLRITGAAGTTTIKHNIFLHTITEGMLCSFFSAIGQRQRGQQLRMNWGTVVGSKGRAKIGIREWTSKNGERMQSNEVKRFYDAETVQQPAANFTPGSF